MSNLIRSSEPVSNETDLLNSAASGTSLAGGKAYESIKTDSTTNRPRPSSPAIIPIGETSVANIDVVIVDPRKPKTPRPAASRSQAAAANSIDTNGSSTPDDDEEVEEEVVLKYGATHVIKLFIPVTTCLVFVIVSLSFITSYRDSGGAHLIYTPFNEDSQQSGGTKLWMSVANAFIFIGVVVVMTIVLILLYKYNCYKVIHGWLAFSSLMLLFFFTYMFISEVFKQFNLVSDMFTISLFLWNFGILGMFCIHWKGPLLLQQAFLIFSCIQMALVFIKYLPEWTTWVLLALISIWDLIAVLCPFGPLRILVETARDRNDNLFPAMVYSSTLMYMMMAKLDNGDEAANAKKNDDYSENVDENVILETSTATNVATSSAQSSRNNARGLRNAAQKDDDDGGFGDAAESHVPAKNKAPKKKSGPRTSSEPEAVRQRIHGRNGPTIADSAEDEHRHRIEQLEHQQQEEQENGVKLGLGDFIFYSILVGKASILGDWNTVIACFLAILIGLCLTLVLLAVFHKPLPALPISLFFGLIFYFLTNLVVRPFYDELTYKQVFI